MRIENVVNLMRERLLDTSQSKFRKYKRIVARRIGIRDRSLMRRTNRLWNEIITGRKYFNIYYLIRNFARSVRKKDMMTFFDELFKKDLAKLSIQQFSTKIEVIPRNSPKLHGLKGKLIDTKNFFRKKNKYLMFK